jgi:hypothetical protein
VSEADSKPVRIGRFQIIRPLGRGATATVYLAHDPRHERQIALKVKPGNANGGSNTAKRGSSSSAARLRPKR